MRTQKPDLEGIRNTKETEISGKRQERGCGGFMKRAWQCVEGKRDRLFVMQKGEKKKGERGIQEMKTTAEKLCAGRIFESIQKEQGSGRWTEREKQDRFCFG